MEPKIKKLLQNNRLALKEHYHHNRDESLDLLVALNKDFAAVVKITFVPICMVPEMRLTGLLADGHIRRCCFLVRAALSLALLGYFTFRMCHDPKILIFQIDILQSFFEWILYLLFFLRAFLRFQKL